MKTRDTLFLVFLIGFAVIMVLIINSLDTQKVRLSGSPGYWIIEDYLRAVVKVVHMNGVEGEGYYITTWQYVCLDGKWVYNDNLDLPIKLDDKWLIQKIDDLFELDRCSCSTK